MVAKLSKVTSPIYNGLVATTYNPWATFPIVQVLTIVFQFNHCLLKLSQTTVFKFYCNAVLQIKSKLN